MPARTLIIEDKVAAWLVAQDAIKALIDTRVFPWGKVPEGASYPYVAYARISGRRLRSTLGPTTKVSCPVIQYDAIGRMYADAKLTAEALRFALEDSLPGQLIGAGYKVQAVTVKRDQDENSPAIHGDEVAESRVIQEFQIWFEEGD